MNHLHASPLVLALTASLACTAGKSDDDPQPCAYAAEMLEDGEEVESTDGCMTLACTNGILVTAEDRRVVVAGDLELASQTAVDAQRCLGVVEGTLRITGTAADLTPIASLQWLSSKRPGSTDPSGVSLLKNPTPPMHAV